MLALDPEGVDLALTQGDLSAGIFHAAEGITPVAAGAGAMVCLAGAFLEGINIVFGVDIVIAFTLAVASGGRRGYNVNHGVKSLLCWSAFAGAWRWLWATGYIVPASMAAGAPTRAFILEGIGDEVLFVLLLAGAPWVDFMLKSEVLAVATYIRHDDAGILVQMSEVFAVATDILFGNAGILKGSAYEEVLPAGFLAGVPCVDFVIVVFAVAAYILPGDAGILFWSVVYTVVYIYISVSATSGANSRGYAHNACRRIMQTLSYCNMDYKCSGYCCLGVASPLLVAAPSQGRTHCRGTMCCPRHLDVVLRAQ